MRYYQPGSSALLVLPKSGEIMESDYSVEAQKLYRDGTVLSQQGRLDEAIQRYCEAIRLDSHYFDAYLARGNCFKDLDKNEEALADYQKAQELQPESSAVYVALGTLFDNPRKLWIPLAYFNKAIETGAK